MIALVASQPQTDPHHPHRLLARVKTETRAGLILRRLCAYFPGGVSKADLMEGAGIRPHIEGPICAAASLYWHIARLNDELPEFGWRIVEDHSSRFGLVRA